MKQRRTRIKICGVRDADIARAAVDAGADAIGLVFTPGSPRTVSIAEAQAVIAALPAFVEPVGLFVNLPPAELLVIAEQLSLRTVQLHGREDATWLEHLRSLRVIKALPFDPASASSQVADWCGRETTLSALLWDTPPDRNTGLTGGSGQTFDWETLADWQRNHATARGPLPRLMLAGGLNAENVGQAISLVHPYAVDVSSGVEVQRGIKDARRIHAFCQAVRAADRGDF